jgi:hypothetical protein
MAIVLAAIILITAAQGIRPMFKGDPAACAWYNDTSIVNPFTQDNTFLGFIPAAVGSRGLNVYDGIDIFARSMDDSLLWYHLNPGNELQGFATVVLPATVSIGSSPAVVQRGPHIIDAFVKPFMFSGDLLHLTWDGRQWSTETLKVPVVSDGPISDPDAGPGFGFLDPIGLAASSWGPDRMDLFLTDSFGGVYQLAWNAGVWGNWEYLQSPPGGADSSPAAASWGRNHIDVVVRGEGQAGQGVEGYYHKSYDLGGWSDGWQSISSSPFSSSPCITATPPFPGGDGSPLKATVFGVGSAMNLHAFSIEPNSMPTYFGGYGGSLNSAPAAINYIGDHFTVFFRGTDNTLWTLDWDVGCCDELSEYNWAPVPELAEYTPPVVAGRYTGAPGEAVPAGVVGAAEGGGSPQAVPGEGERAVQVEVPEGPGFDLTGVWSGDDGANYEIRQIRNEVWWFGEHPQGWANVAYGTFDARGLLIVKWADIRGTGYGTLTLKADKDHMNALINVGGFGGSIWNRSK